ALSYPIGILSLAGLCCLVITWILLPQLASVLESFGAEPPLPTRILLAIAHYRFWLFNLLAAPLVGLAFFYRFHRQRWDRWWRESLYRLPLVGNLWVARGQADLAEDLALASEAGLALVEALRLLAQSSQDPLLGPALARLAKGLEDGYEIDQALAGETALSPNLRHSLVVGLNTGKLVVLLKATSRNLEQELRFRTDQLLALLEPVVMAGLGCITGFVVIASLLPIYTVVNSV
ncbi:MAG: type II secretion system F family protein, partial [Candidatus Eremiobacteraeota bacterium]|nr:type II secretion system F family protein [Candidatus Eremiobacteraeota bacterium]